MMTPSPMAFQMKLFEYSVTTVTKSSSNRADQTIPNLTLPLFTAVPSSNYESIRHTIRPVLAGTDAVLRLCPGVPVSQPKSPGYALNQPA